MVLFQFLQSLRRREDGQALVEYALILSLVSVVSVAALGLLGVGVDNILDTIVTDL